MAAVRVGPLSFNVSEDHLKEIFGNCGKVIAVKVARNERGQSLQWATVAFATAEDAREAIRFMNDGQIDGLTITVRPAELGTVAE
jgi:RNA recognition motif-containing protein